MATVYFTNNADSGDGSLRAAIEAAADGDIVTYSDSAFADADEIVILLSFELAIRKDVTIDARAKRIALDGQGLNPVVFLRASVTLKQLDIIRGGGYYNGAGVASFYGNSVLDKCRLCGNALLGDVPSGSAAWINTGSIMFRDCIIAGNMGDQGGNTSAAIRTETGTATLVRCTAVGNYPRALSAQTEGDITVQDSLVQGAHNVPGVTSITPSTAGFVAPCPDIIDPESWDNALWESWDFRLTSESPYLSGAETVEEGDVDVLGHARKVNGAIGAYEGAWKVIDDSETWTLTQNETVEYLDVKDGGRVELAGYFLNVQEKAYLFSNGSFVDTVGKQGYVGCNEVVRYGLGPPVAPPDRVSIVERGADVTSIKVSNIGVRRADIEITKNGTGEYSILVSQIGSEDWRVVESADEFYNPTDIYIPTDRAFKVRVFDGDKFLDSAPNPRKYYFTGTTTGSFAEKTDWALDAEKTFTCSESPTIAGCTFICE